MQKQDQLQQGKSSGCAILAQFSIGAIPCHYRRVGTRRALRGLRLLPDLGGYMFERYTEKARRVIFFARYEASQFGSPYIETEHLLLGLLREDNPMVSRHLPSPGYEESILKQIKSQTAIRDKIATSVDLPLSNECKRVLAYAAEESMRLGHNHIGTEHLLLGLLRETGCFAERMLSKRGADLKRLREELSERSAPKLRCPVTPTPCPFIRAFLAKADLRDHLCNV